MEKENKPSSTELYAISMSDGMTYIERGRGSHDFKGKLGLERYVVVPSRKIISGKYTTPIENSEKIYRSLKKRCGESIPLNIEQMITFYELKMDQEDIFKERDD